jgi:RNA polymerase sigma-70 factor (ECF subfamily)
MADRMATDGLTTSTVQRAAAGSEAAFAALVAEHNVAMVRVAYVILGDREAARDAVQSAWAHAWRRLDSIRDESKIRSWLVAVAANQARDALRHHRRRGALPLTIDLPAPATEDPDRAIAVIDLERVLRGLKPEDRALLALRYVGGLDSSEIATQLGLSPSGVRTRLMRLLERLRMDLGDA